MPPDALAAPVPCHCNTAPRK